LAKSKGITYERATSIPNKYSSHVQLYFIGIFHKESRN